MREFWSSELYLHTILAVIDDVIDSASSWAIPRVLRDVSSLYLINRVRTASGTTVPRVDVPSNGRPHEGFFSVTNIS